MIRAATLLICLPAFADAACRQALALGLDVSGSVDTHEYRLQLEGLATALQSDRVQEVLFLQAAAPIRISVYEWSGPQDQHLILPWTTLQSVKDLQRAVGQLWVHQRNVAAPTTAIGSALLTGFALLDQQPDCWKRTLDISGDGRANTGPRPQDISSTRLPDGVTVNGLVIDGSPTAELANYYESYVIRGSGAFVETAQNFEEYAKAMERKLLRELESIATGALE
ncbi:DUF1194 domain-containing protein [Loktanella sp. S4079]|uniref:DUF1194 domain-containing protein n=1 Tax=Loktanella sp. S4079 TaxID=579483 RepID=UPI0005F9C91C|nr:DUF1194 domain-containing protein [Loktanella sp. S4079]KJZ19769.1 lipoprotein [Loktanella sp. S4079]